MKNQILVELERGTFFTNAIFYLFFFIFFVYLVMIKFINKPKYKNLPPSPSKIPFLGNLHQVRRGLPHHAFQALAQKHGPLMLLQLGNVPTIVVSSADLARDVMKTYDHVFSSRPTLMFPKRLLYDKDIAFAGYGDYWRQVRKICTVQLLNAKKVHSFQSLREEEIVFMMQKIDEAFVSNLSLVFISLTNDYVCRAAFGRKYNQGERGKKFKKIMKEFTFLVGSPNIGDLIPSLAWVNYLNGLYARLEKNFNELDSFLDEVIEEHIEKKTKKMMDDNYSTGCENEVEDFVDVMLRIEEDCTLGIPFARDSTKGLILDIFAAGTDTSSVTLEWAMSELLRDPKIMEEVQNEVRAIAAGKMVLKDADIEEMHYLKAVMKETMRLHPPLTLLVPRESMEYVNLQGYDIPSKTRVIINAYAIGRDPMWWENPEKFCPKRFLQDGSSASVHFKGCDFQLIPFGAGRRVCPGLNFAMSIVELALANLLNRFDWSLPEGMDAKFLDMEEGAGLTAYRKSDLLVIATPRFNIP